MKQIPEELRYLQDVTRKQTIEKIENSINELKAEGYLITIKDLMERTGFSRSLFSKSHVRKVLKENHIGKYKKIITVEKREETIMEKIYKLEIENNKAIEKIKSLSSIINKKDSTILNLKDDLTNKTMECEVLRGELHILMQKARILGIDFKLAEVKK